MLQFPTRFITGSLVKHADHEAPPNLKDRLAAWGHITNSEHLGTLGNPVLNGQLGNAGIVGYVLCFVVATLMMIPTGSAWFGQVY